MFYSNMNLVYLQSGDKASVGDDQVTRAALRLYHSARAWSWLGKLWSGLTRRPRRLLDLETVQATCGVRHRHYAGTQVVPIRQIRGSEGRGDDFDAHFQPLQPHNRQRWLSVAAALQRGVTLPLVELIQIGDVYFVRDGHHRISVARALGQEHIDAEVTVWDIRRMN